MSDIQNAGFSFGISTGADASNFAINQLPDVFGIVKGKLQQAANNPSFFTDVFGDKASTPELRSVIEEWRGGIFSQLPSVQVISAADMNVADGAYASSTQKIYLSDSLFQSSAAPVNSVLGAAGVLTEETFHWLDDRVGTDTSGDEGEFAKDLSFGVKLSGSELSRIKAEDDRGFINVAGKSVIVEQALINGKNSDEVIYGSNGNDTINANGGNDTVYGGGNDDRIWGGSQDDKLWGEDGADELRGDDGNDELRGGNQDDKLWGGSQDDKLWGENGNDELRGDGGNDELRGGNNEDKIWGGENEDKLWGESGNDQLNGDSGNDILNGYGFDNSEQDILTGGTGSDRFVLGDAYNTFYTKNGASDFATITDFNRYEDIIQLNQLSLDAVSSTQAWGYRLVTVGNNTEIRLDSNGDRLAVLNGVSGLSLTSGQGFTFEGKSDVKTSLIINLYKDVLDRAPDAGGLQTWTNALGKTLTLPEIRNAIAHSIEAQNLITKLYKDIFDRTNVDGGMKTWTDALGSGWTVTQVRNAIAHSIEAQNLITKLYKDIFDRTNVGGGMQTWTDALGAGWTLVQVRNEIAHSFEAKTLITGLYQSILGRVPDAGGMQTWTDALGSGWTLPQVRSGFINSDEAKKLQQVGIWRGEYFNNRDLSGYSTFARFDSEINNDWGNGGPSNGIGNDNFSIRWTGKFNFSGGDYVFHAKADDGVRLWIDGNLIIDQWKDQGATEYTEVRNLTGVHQVKVEYYENGGGAISKIWWESTPVNVSINSIYDPKDGDNVVIEGNSLRVTGTASYAKDISFRLGDTELRTTSLEFNGNSFVATLNVPDGLALGDYQLKVVSLSLSGIAKSFYGNSVKVVANDSVTKSIGSTPIGLERHITLQRVNSSGYIENCKTWVVIHGWENLSDDVAGLAQAIDGYQKGDQVLTLDWDAARTGKLGLLESANWIDKVARNAVDLLQGWGISASNLNIVGFSLGTYVGSEIGRIYKEETTSTNLKGLLNNLILLDPAALGSDFDIGGGRHNVARFSDVAKNSVAFVVSDVHFDGGWAGDNNKAATASYSFIVSFKNTYQLPSSIADYHSGVHQLYTDLIRKGFTYTTGVATDKYDNIGQTGSDMFHQTLQHEGVLYARWNGNSWVYDGFVDTSGSSTINWI